MRPAPGILPWMVCAVLALAASACDSGDEAGRRRFPEYASGTNRFRMPVRDVQTSPNGRFLAVGTGIVLVLDLVAEKQVAGIDLDGSEAACVGVTPDGRYVAAGLYTDGGGRRVVLWDLAGKEPKEIARTLVDDRVFEAMSMSFDGRRVAVAQSTGNVHVLSVPGLDLVERIHAHSFPGTGAYCIGNIDVAFLHTGPGMVSCGSDGAVRLWDENHREVRSRTGLGLLFRLAISGDDRLLAVQRALKSAPSDVLLLDLETLETVRVLQGIPLSVAMTLSPDGAELAVGGEWSTYVRIYETRTGRQIQALSGPVGREITLGKSFIETITYTGDGKLLVTGSRDGYLTQYKRGDG